MSASSVNRKVAEVQKAQKMERRNTIEKRNEPVNDKPKHIEAEIRGVPAKASGSDSPVVSQEVQEKKPVEKKSFFKKKKAAKKG